MAALTDVTPIAKAADAAAVAKPTNALAADVTNEPTLLEKFSVSVCALFTP